jgi:hypothetical protein
VNRIFQAALDIQDACLSRGWRFCIIGAVAVQRWGEPRLTRDVDLTVLSGFGSEAEYVDALLAAYEPRIDGARDFALRHRVVLIRTAAGVALVLDEAGPLLELKEAPAAMQRLRRLLGEREG